MVKITKLSDFRKIFKSLKSRIALLIVLIITLIIVASVAVFLFLDGYNPSRPLICRKNNYFLTSKQSYRTPLAGDSFADDKNINNQPQKPVQGPDESKKVPILMYHYIEPVPPFTSLPHLYEDPTVFENQLASLKNYSYNSVLIRDLGWNLKGSGDLPDNPIILTFDDGYDDFYTTVFPMLKKYDMKAVLYVIVDFIDNPGYITSAQAKEMAGTKYVEIASHTLGHVNLKKATDQEAYYQLAESKKRLADIIGRPVEDFAYPFGFFSQRDESIANRVGYLTAASTYPGVRQNHEDRFSLFRLRPHNRTGEEFISWLESEKER